MARTTEGTSTEVKDKWFKEVYQKVDAGSEEGETTETGEENVNEGEG